MMLLSMMIVFCLDWGILVNGYVSFQQMVPSVSTPASVATRGYNMLHSQWRNKVTGDGMIVDIHQSLCRSNRSFSRRRNSILHEKAMGNEVVVFDSSFDSVMNLSRLYNRSSWISWWIQIVLSVISGVILTFANTVRQSSSKNIAVLWSSGFAFSSVGVLLAFLNALWTWNVTILTRRIFTKKLFGRSAVLSLKKYSRISVAMSLIGMLFSLIGAEQIVGTLASKILSSPGLAFSPLLTTGTATTSPFQAVDIFLVQANTNALVAHFASLVCYIILQTQLPALPNGTLDSRTEKPSSAAATGDNSTGVNEK